MDSRCNSTYIQRLKGGMTMARSKNCLKCKYCGRLSGGMAHNWRNDYTCDYLIMTGKIGDKGDDVDHCKLFEKKTGKRVVQLY